MGNEQWIMNNGQRKVDNEQYTMHNLTVNNEYCQ